MDLVLNAFTMTKCVEISVKENAKRIQSSQVAQSLFPNFDGLLPFFFSSCVFSNTPFLLPSSVSLASSLPPVCLFCLSHLSWLSDTSGIFCLCLCRCLCLSVSLISPSLSLSLSVHTTARELESTQKICHLPGFAAISD